MSNATLRLCALTGLLFTFAAVQAQVTPARSMPPAAGVFVEGSALNLSGENNGKAEYGSYLFGGSAGIFLQPGSWIGLEARVTALESHLHENRSERLRAVLGGPRVAWHRGRFHVYATAQAGVGDTNFVLPPAAPTTDSSPALSSATGADLEGDTGLDVKLFGRLYWRAAEVSYNHLFVNQGPSGVKLSSGFRIKLFR